MQALCESPFLLLEKDENKVVSDVFRKNHLKPDIRFTTRDDYAIMSMVESGLGISILPELVLRRIPYRIVVKELEVPAYRNIGISMPDRKSCSLAVRKFLDYLDYR